MTAIAHDESVTNRTDQSLRPVCPHCGEWRADMLTPDDATHRWYCALCGRIARVLALAPVPAPDAAAYPEMNRGGTC